MKRALWVDKMTLAELSRPCCGSIAIRQEMMHASPLACADALTSRYRKHWDAVLVPLQPHCRTGQGELRAVDQIAAAHAGSTCSQRGHWFYSATKAGVRNW